MSKNTYILETHTFENENGQITIDTIEKTISKETEPDYIKLYTKVWCEFNEIPIAYRTLFLELAQRMSYCDKNDLNHSQIVYTGTPISESIMSKLKWKKNMYQKGLKVLCNCNAIKKISRGVYQINPNYAGRGAWKYNPKLKQGGVKDLITTFSFADKTVNTQIIWADDETDSELNRMFRQGMNVEQEQDTVITHTKISNT